MTAPASAVHEYTACVGCANSDLVVDGAGHGHTAAEAAGITSESIASGRWEDGSCGLAIWTASDVNLPASHTNNGERDAKAGDHQAADPLQLGTHRGSGQLGSTDDLDQANDGVQAGVLAAAGRHN